MVPPLSAAVRPGGRLLALKPSGPVPPVTAMVPLRPGWFTVQAVDDSAPSAGAALMVRLKPALAMAPLASLTVALMLKVPVDVGVPLTVIVLSLSAAVRPAGRPV